MTLELTPENIAAVVGTVSAAVVVNQFLMDAAIGKALNKLVEHLDEKYMKHEVWARRVEHVEMLVERIDGKKGS